MVDQEVCRIYIDKPGQTTHKIKRFLGMDPFQQDDFRVKQMFELLQKCYSDSMAYVSFVPTQRYGSNDDFCHFAVLAEEPMEPKQLIPGLHGHVARYPNDMELTSDMEFSVFGPSAVNSATRLMLGPASFVNHDCNPNARFAFGEIFSEI